MTTVTGADYPNAKVIYQGLIAMGLNANAAAGVAGNIYQESGGNPSVGNSAGGGLFGEEIQNGGSAGGGTMAEQLAALAKYIAANGSISDINNNASTPQAAAIYFMQKYERPNVALENEANRVAAANYVASAAKTGNWGAGVTTNPPPGGGGGGGGSGGLLSIPGDITTFFDDFDKFVNALEWILVPSHWVRIISFVVGGALLTMAIYALLQVAEGNSPMPSMPAIVPVPV